MCEMIRVRLVIVLVLAAGWAPAVTCAQEHLLVTDARILELLGVSDADVRNNLGTLQRKYKNLETRAALEITNGRLLSAIPKGELLEIQPRLKEQQDELDKLAIEELKLILDEEQLKRLRQLRIQALGPEGVLRGLFNEPLQINEEQLEKLKEEAASFFQTFGNGREAQLAQMNQAGIRLLFRRELLKHLVSKMTEEQQKMFGEMTGELVDLPRLADLR